MKRTGKIAAAFITALTAVASITACSADYSHIDGYSDIENARKLYSSLYSAEITVTDKQTGTVTQELTFCSIRAIPYRTAISAQTAKQNIMNITTARSTTIIPTANGILL